MPPPIAHVDYVTDPEASADPIGFLLDALADPGNLLILGVGALLGGGWLGAGSSGHITRRPEARQAKR